jgi:hypothetical protein
MQLSGAAESVLDTVIRTLRRHWALALLLAAGLVLRVMTQLAYQPALIYIDSKKYVTNEWEGADPVGYTLLLLRPVLWFGNLMTVTVVQHLLGLAMAVTIYALLLRFGAPRWGAALATAPVLLDAYQLQAEQTIMPDVAFEVLAVAGMVVLLWRRRPTLALAVTGGVLLGATATVRQVGEALIVPALAFVLLANSGWRRRLGHGAAITAAFALPILGYMTYSQFGQHQHFQLSRMGTDMLYGRAAHAADCATLKVPPYQRSLCPSSALAQSSGVDGLVNNPTSPAYYYPPTGVRLPAGTDSMRAIKNFSYHVLQQQPLRVIGDITSDAIKIFALTRSQVQGDTPISRWQFQTTYPLYPPGVTDTGSQLSNVNLLFESTGGGKARAYRPLASALRHYQLGGGYMPGPVFLLTLLLGLGGILTWRRRPADESGELEGDTHEGPPLPLTCLLVTGLAVAALLGADFYEFSWRYQLPALILLPPAGVLGTVAIAGRIKGRKRARKPAAEPVPGPGRPAVAAQGGD